MSDFNQTHSFNQDRKVQESDGDDCSEKTKNPSEIRFNQYSCGKCVFFSYSSLTSSYPLICPFPSLPVLCEVPPAPPQNIHVDNWLLKWTPGTKDTDVTYTVKYSRWGLMAVLWICPHKTPVQLIPITSCCFCSPSSVLTVRSGWMFQPAWIFLLLRVMSRRSKPWTSWAAWSCISRQRDEGWGPGRWKPAAITVRNQHPHPELRIKKFSFVQSFSHLSLVNHLPEELNKGSLAALVL